MKVDKEKLKFVGGAIIVGAALLVMFPGFVQEAMGLWRLGLIFLIVGGGALAVSYATMYIKKNRRS